MYTIEERDAARDYVLQLAETDDRVVAAAAVGSLALGGGDRWSDLDLTFGVADGVDVKDVLEDWTSKVVADRDAVVLFDLPSGDIIYRVFLLPDGLQVDLSFMPASRFGAAGPRFRLLFGEAHERPSPSPTSQDDLFGWGVAYARDARACIERGRFWMAEHCISALRDNALTIASVQRGLPGRFGRGYDDLPKDVLDAFVPTFVASLDRASLLGALRAAVEGLLRESRDIPSIEKCAPRVRTFLVLTEPPDGTE
jgi:predicted nucleotidyltransferase